MIVLTAGALPPILLWELGRGRYNIGGLPTRWTLLIRLVLTAVDLVVSPFHPKSEYFIGTALCAEVSGDHPFGCCLVEVDDCQSDYPPFAVDSFALDYFHSSLAR